MVVSHRFWLVGVLWLLAVPSARAQQEWLGWVGGKRVYLAWPDEGLKPGQPVLLALHGSGREAESYRPESPQGVPFYVHQRDLALSGGYLFAAVSNGRATWGTDEGLQAVLTLYDSLRQHAAVAEKWVLWGSSAGGVLTNRLVREHPDKVLKVLGTFPVYDLAAAFDHLQTARDAWQEKEKAERANPARDPAPLSKVPYLLFHGREDEAVPAPMHSERLRQEVNALGGQVQLYLVPGGHSTQNFALYQDDLIRAFLQK